MIWGQKPPFDGQKIMIEEEVKALLKEFFEILDTREESDGGVEFSPVFISSCRVLLTKRLGDILSKLKTFAKEP